ncbi:MAG TPA: Xaa-Pro peptidase family protein [Spirochaetia bacterium]|nr:Xaa-Pro peptidase family protein [Spirochaetia bacterium]
MRLKPLSASEYEGRIQRLQAEISRAGLDAFVGYSSESESGCSRYLTGFWPFFDFSCVVVPATGRAALITGGPESYEFASRFVRAADIRVNPLLVESSPPDWVPQSRGESFSTLLPSVCGKTPRRIGVGGWNIFPHVLFEDLRKGAPAAAYVPADDMLLRVQSIKTDAEIPYIVEAYRITEAAMKAAFSAARPGKTEWEIEAAARAAMAELGAEGTSYPPWVCSGPNTALSLCRSTDRAIQKNELVQLTLGARYMGYCGNMCRPFSIGKATATARKLIEVGLEAMQFALAAIRPGKRASDVFHGYYEILARHGFESFTLYGPAHGTGHSEVEGLWLAEKADFVIQPNMLFNIDIWLSDGQNGMRWEDGVLVTRDGLRELTSWRREIIEA